MGSFHRRRVNAFDLWPPVPAGSLFGLANLPFGVFSHPSIGSGTRRIGVAVGEDGEHADVLAGVVVVQALAERQAVDAELGAERVFAVDAASSFSRPGPRLVDGVELAAVTEQKKFVTDGHNAGNGDRREQVLGTNPLGDAAPHLVIEIGENRTVILSTHNLDEVDRVADRVGVLRTRLIALCAACTGHDLLGDRAAVPRTHGRP